MPEFTIGLPAYNEESSVRNVAETVSKGLKLAGVNERDARIILLDSDSSDRTISEFRDANLEYPHEIMVIKEGVRGKGANLLSLLRHIDQGGGGNMMTFDADLTSIAPDWISKYVGKISEGADYVTPNYSRNKYEGSATNHLAFPILYGTSGRYIRQPIGGDFALSRRFCEHLLKQEVHQDVLRYGIDIFFTASAVFGGFKMASEKLGRKIHKPSFPQLATMFPHIANALHQQIQSNRDSWNIFPAETLLADDVENIESFPHRQKAQEMKDQAIAELRDTQSVSHFHNAIMKVGKEGYLDESDWIMILGEFCRSTEFNEVQIKVLTELYKVRIATFWEAIRQLDAASVEALLLTQALEFRKFLCCD